MLLEKYESYKDSGVEWLGEIPEGWGLCRLKNIGTVSGRVGWKALTASEYVDEGYIFLATPNIKHKEIDFINVNYITHERYIESPEIMLKAGDILLAKDGSTLGIVNIITQLPSESTVNSSIGVLRFRSDLNKRFIFYQFKNNYIENTIKIKKNGMGVPHLFQEDIKKFHLLLPLKQLQTEIANFLDIKTSQIDQKIKLLKEKTKSYEELKKSLINETVCCGLDKDVELKDSGVEWIGMIPKEWNVKRGKDKFFYHKVINRGMASKNVLSLTYGGVINKDFETTAGLNPTSYETYQFVNKDDLIFKLIDLENIKTSRVGIVHEDGIMSSAYIRLNPNNMIFSKYFYYLYFYYYRINLFNYIGGGVRSTLKYSSLLEIPIIFPSLPQQTKIASYLDEKTSKIDSIITKLKNQITTLTEFRKTLINDIVTGKIKVPEVV